MNELSYNQQLYLKRKEKGLCCSCGNKLKNGYVQCNNCLERKRDYMKDKMKNPIFRQKHNERISSFKWKKHKDVIKLLGGVCVNCKEDNILVLQVNHLNGNGNKEYKNGNNNNEKFYRGILNGKRDTKDLDVRCANCNILFEYEMGRRTNWFERSDV